MNVTVGSLRVSAQTADYEYKRVVGADRTFVYGSVSIENGGPVAETFELDALRLSFDHVVSKGACVDSVASVLPSIAIDRWTTIRRDVYWVFRGRVPSPELNEVQLLYMRAGDGE